MSGVGFNTNTPMKNCEAASTFLIKHYKFLCSSDRLYYSSTFRNAEDALDQIVGSSATPVNLHFVWTALRDLEEVGKSACAEHNYHLLLDCQLLDEKYVERMKAEVDGHVLKTIEGIEFLQNQWTRTILWFLKAYKLRLILSTHWDNWVYPLHITMHNAFYKKDCVAVPPADLVKFQCRSDYNSSGTDFFMSYSRPHIAMKHGFSFCFNCTSVCLEALATFKFMDNYNDENLYLSVFEFLLCPGERAGTTHQSKCGCAYTKMPFNIGMSPSILKWHGEVREKLSVGKKKAKAKKKKTKV